VREGAMNDGAPGCGVLAGGPRKRLLKDRQALRRQPIARAEMEAIVRKAQDEAELSLAEMPRALRDRLERGLDIGGRAGDYSENLARRHLLPLGLGQCLCEAGALGSLLLERSPQSFDLGDEMNVRAQASTTIARPRRDWP
jgi:hypothetical protein